MYYWQLGKKRTEQMNNTTKNQQYHRKKKFLNKGEPAFKNWKKATRTRKSSYQMTSTHPGDITGHQG